MPQGRSDRTLMLTRIIDAPPARVFDAWTKPDLLKQWFAPKPYTTLHAEIDLRVGDANNIMMRSPDGQDLPNDGAFLEVIPNRKIVITDGFTAGWVPKSGRPFMVVTVELADAPGGKTRYTATARHWDIATTKRHAQMGFHEGWGICADQLNELVGRQT